MSLRPRLIAMRPSSAQRLAEVAQTQERSAGTRGVDVARGVRHFRPVSESLISGRDYQWEYTLRPQRFDPTAKQNVDLEDADDVVAYNLFELGNTIDRVAPGIEMASILAAGWDCYPVGRTRTGARVDLSFPAWPVADDAGDLVWLFCEENPIDGLCPTEETA